MAASRARWLVIAAVVVFVVLPALSDGEGIFRLVIVGLALWLGWHALRFTGLIGSHGSARRFRDRAAAGGAGEASVDPEDRPIEELQATLRALADLRDQGRITDVDYERARARAIAEF